MESILLTMDPDRDDLLPLLTAVARATGAVKFMVECDYRLAPAALLVRRIQALMEALPGRILVSIQCDGLLSPPHETENLLARARNGGAGDLLAMFRALREPRPELFVVGNSAETAALAIKYADCMWQSHERAEEVYPQALPILHFGKEVGLRMSMIGRRRAAEALASDSATFTRARREGLVGTCEGALFFLSGMDGKVPAERILVGSFEDLADAIMRFRISGISHFLLSLPIDARELLNFCDEVLPLVRYRERRLST